MLCLLNYFANWMQGSKHFGFLKGMNGFMLRKFFLGMSLANLCIGFVNQGYAVTTYKDVPPHANNNKSYFNIDFLYVQPSSNNLKYGTFVSGTQPYYQSWHYLQLNPSYHPAFDLGFHYALSQSLYSIDLDWTHLNSNDSSSKQASTNIDLATVEFVAPPFEMSPPVFGIKHVDSKVNFAFDNVLLNVDKKVESDSHLQTRYFGGLDILNLNQTITTTFSDYAGAPATPYSYALPPDPLFSFELENVSKYLGIGPDIGLDVRYSTDSGFGVFGDVVGSLTAGLIQAQDNFTSTSTRLTLLGIGTSHQEITTPNMAQVVVGADGKFGVFYSYSGHSISNLTIELGYRLANYFNAISMINPNTLVQPGTDVLTPEFSTGTMAIVSTSATSHPFGFNGPFLSVKVAI